MFTAVPSLVISHDIYLQMKFLCFPSPRFNEGEGIRFILPFVVIILEVIFNKKSRFVIETFKISHPPEVHIRVSFDENTIFIPEQPRVRVCINEPACGSGWRDGICRKCHVDSAFDCDNLLPLQV